MCGPGSGAILKSVNEHGFGTALPDLVSVRVAAVSASVGAPGQVSPMTLHPRRPETCICFPTAANRRPLPASDAEPGGTRADRRSLAPVGGHVPSCTRVDQGSHGRNASSQGAIVWQYQAMEGVPDAFVAH